MQSIYADLLATTSQDAKAIQEPDRPEDIERILRHIAERIQGTTDLQPTTNGLASKLLLMKEQQNVIDTIDTQSVIKPGPLAETSVDIPEESLYKVIVARLEKAIADVQKVASKSSTPLSIMLLSHTEWNALVVECVSNFLVVGLKQY